MRKVGIVALFAVSATFAQDQKEAKGQDYESRAIVGFHQAGASSADSQQNFFSDFFVVRPIGRTPADGAKKVYDYKFNLWGDVRIASSPQQITVPVSQFAAGFSEAVGKLPVNQLALSGEFVTGFEWRPWGNYKDKLVQPTRIRSIGLVAFFGASGAFSDAVSRASVFRAVTPASPQWSNFVTQFPQYAGPSALDPNGNGKYVALVPPDRERFFRQYGGGIRYTSYKLDGGYAPPEMYTVTLGQDQAVTRGRYVGPVLKLDAFYPLPITVNDKDWSFIYLFGTANLAIARPMDHTPLAMQLVSGACTTGQDPTTCGILPSASNVAVVTIPTSRDTYRMGVGIDVVALLKQWAAAKK